MSSGSPLGDIVDPPRQSTGKLIWDKVERDIEGALVNSHVAIVLAHEEPFAIGEAIVRPATRELDYGGRIAVVEPRVMQVLVALWKAHGLVLSKDDLNERCWNGRIVGDDAINRVIARLRHNAQDDAGGSFWIETVTRVGYRLRTDEIDVEHLSPPRSAAIDRRLLLVGGSALGVAAASAGIWQWTSGSQDSLPPDVAALLVEAQASINQGMPDDYANAVGKLRVAVGRAPESAETWGALALAYVHLATLSPEQEYEAQIERARAAADRALAIDPNQGEALTARIRSTSPADYVELDRRLTEARRRAPQSGPLATFAANFLSLVGRHAESLPEYRKAIGINPAAPRLLFGLITSLWTIGRLDETEAELERAFAQWPRFYAIWFLRLYFLALNGRASEALAMIDSEGTRPLSIPDWNFALTRVQITAFQTRAKADADQAITQLLKAAEKGSGFLENAIVTAGAFDRVELGLSLLNRFFFESRPNDGLRFAKEQGLYNPSKKKHTFVLWHRQLESIRADPRFNLITERLGLERYWRVSGTRPDYRRG